MSSGHGFRETDKRFECTHSDLVGASMVVCLLPLSDGLVLFLEDLCTLPCELGVNGPAEFNVSLDLFHLEVWLQSIIHQSVHVDDVLGNLEVLVVILLVEYNEEDVESGHNRG